MSRALRYICYIRRKAYQKYIDEINWSQKYYSIQQFKIVNEISQLQISKLNEFELELEFYFAYIQFSTDPQIALLIGADQ